ncbi:MAG: HlyD family efflux transporter periplasmic adaptor subunit [Burkholderiaceae bacterium]|nr:HlyD family efflux transporter periplasmic adaptor subunit [Burkholderiaceae bacterium]
MAGRIAAGRAAGTTGRASGAWRRALAATCTLAALALLGGCERTDDGRLLGYAEGEELRLAASAPGRLVTVNVQRGEQVNAGAPLFALEADSERLAREDADSHVAQARALLANLEKGRRPDEISAIGAQLRQARAALELSESEFRRQAQLVAELFVSPAALDQARANRDRDRARISELESQLRVARQGARPDEIVAARRAVDSALAQRAQADWRLAQKALVAPVAGDIIDVNYRLGEWVPAGSPVVMLLPPGNRRMRFFVPEDRLGEIRLGQAIRAHCDGCGAPIGGRIDYIARSAEFTAPIIYSREVRSTLVFRVEARPTPADALRLHPGQPLQVELEPAAGTAGTTR